MKVYLSKAIRIEGKDWKIACDGTQSQHYPLVFYSHAHSDHIPRRIPKTEIISSEITKLLIKEIRPSDDDTIFHDSYTINDTTFSQVSSGHIVGSTALVIESTNKKLIYTGDVSIRDKGFLEPFSPQQCDVLIVESTFGKPKYVFPAYDGIIKEAQEKISEYIDKGIPVVLMGYALGKAQLLYHAFSHLSETIIMHGSNYKINKVLLENKTKGSVPSIPYIQAKEDGIFDKVNNWILFAPLKSGRNEFNAYLKRKYNTKLFAFSGWCISPDYKFRMSVDHAYPISDHADFNELLEICNKCNPDKIYTIYGDNIRFAAELRKRNFNAHPLSKQTLLDSYF